MNVLPKPLKQEITEGTFVLQEGATFSVDSSFKWIKQQFSQAVSALSFPVTCVESGGQIEFCLEKEMDSEEYLLSVTPSGVKITGGGEAGAFYGLQSFIQAARLRFHPVGKVFVQCVNIVDKPRYAYRGIMLDVARHFTDVETVKEILDNMSYYKMNRFHWHLSDDVGFRLEIKKYPLLTEIGSIRAGTMKTWARESYQEGEYGRGLYYTQEQVKDIVDYAQKLHIEIVPEIDMPAHLQAAIAAYPQISCKGEKVPVLAGFVASDVLGCVGSEAFMTFARDVVDELVQLFPGHYIHIGGDEVRYELWKGCPRCEKLMKEQNLKDISSLQGYFNAVMQSYIKEKGRAMIGWNELLETTAVDKSTAIQWWTESKLATDYVKQGGKVLLSYRHFVYLDYCYAKNALNDVYSYGREAHKISAEYEKNILGIEAPLWTEFVPSKAKQDLLLYPRMQALAEISWSHLDKKRNFYEFEVRLQQFLQEMTLGNINFANPAVYKFRTLKDKLGRRKRLRDMSKDNELELKLNYQQRRYEPTLWLKR